MTWVSNLPLHLKFSTSNVSKALILPQHWLTLKSVVIEAELTRARLCKFSTTYGHEVVQYRKLRARTVRDLKKLITMLANLANLKSVEMEVLGINTDFAGKEDRFGKYIWDAFWGKSNSGRCHPGDCCSCCGELPEIGVIERALRAETIPRSLDTIDGWLKEQRTWGWYSRRAA
jgi:hypothetical protein